MTKANLQTPVAEEIPSENYRKVIQINVPIRFYWTEDEFDGIEMTINKDWDDIPIKEKLLINEVLESCTE